MNRHFAVLILLIASCTKTKDHDFAGLSRLCGAADYSEADQVVLLESPSQELLTAGDIQDLKAQFRAADGTVNRLVPSARGCLKLPHGEGRVEIQSPRLAWGLARSIEGESLPRLSRWSLQKAGSYQFKLACPAEGLFTSPTMSLPILSQIEGSAELFDLQLRLRDSEERPHLIFHKSLGQTFVRFPESVSLDTLPEGTYTLDVRLRDLTRDWDEASASQIQSCPVTLIRSAPGLSGTSLVNHLGLEIFKKGEALPLTVSDPRSRLYVCREKASPSAACETNALCQKPENFSLATRIALEDPGSWQYFVAAENIVKVRSRPTCRKIFVSNSAPMLTASWKNPVADEPNAALREPISQLELQIAVQHPVVPVAQLEDSLQCRAEFLIGGLLSRKGADVTCLNGRCQGLNLENWQPCDKDLRVSIAAALQVPNLLNSQLRLLVRTDDGAGQTQEISKAVWLQKSRWTMTDVSQGDASDSALAPDGSLVFVNNAFQTLQVKQGVSILMPPPGAAVANGVKLASLSDGSLVAAFRVNESSIFAEYHKGQWRLLNIQGWNKAFAPCSRLIPDTDGTFTCSSQGALTRLSRERMLLRGENAPSCLGLFSDTVARLGEKDWVVSCRRSLHRFVAAENRWMDVDNLAGFIADGALERDGLGRVWLVTTAVFGGALAVAYVDDKGLQSVPSPLPVQPDFPSLTLARNPRGQMQFLDRVWDDSSRSWNVLPEIQRQFPAKTSIRVKRVINGGLLYESEHLLVYEDPQGRLTLYPWKGLDLPTRSAIENFQRNAAGETFIHAAFRSRRTVYQYGVRHWAYFGKSFLNLADAPILPYRFQGTMQVQSISQGTFALSNGAWQNVCEEFNGSYNTAFASSQGLFLGTSEGLLGCDAKTRTWQSVLSFDEEHPEDFRSWLMLTAANIVEDAAGRIWFGKQSGRLIYREGSRFEAFAWPEENGLIDALMRIQGQVATIGYDRLTIWNEAKAAFDVTLFADLGIDEASYGQVKSTEQGLLIYAPDAEHFRVLDRNQGSERTERGMSGCQQFLSRRDGSLICFTWDGVYHQVPGAEWIRLLSLDSLDRKHAILENDRYLWVPVTGNDIIRLDLPEIR